MRHKNACLNNNVFISVMVISGINNYYNLMICIICLIVKLKIKSETKQENIEFDIIVNKEKYRNNINNNASGLN